MSYRCNSCGNYIYKGTKFNMQKEVVIGEDADKEKRKRDSQETGDAMKYLKNRILYSKREMAILANLYELKSMKSRHAGVSSEKSLEGIRKWKAEVWRRRGGGSTSDKFISHPLKRVISYFGFILVLNGKHMPLLEQQWK
ncbi:coiled-coil protein [Thalictrum thalictroides]|uniref:Coiled-coil protein n=1 Tax=Thalictrum thalictroides TaxID=46969 RepID=A0A7J6VEZ7_THATH|nr:coiled-coil protein [Thalictrum thalictroides]